MPPDDKKNHATVAPVKSLMGVKLAKDPDGTPEDLTVALEVWLSPTGVDPLAWEKFTTTQAKTQWVLTPATPGGKIKLPTKHALWCVWSDPTKTTLTPANATFGKVTGFGWPLLARPKGSVLVLPNWRTVQLVWFDVTGPAPANPPTPPPPTPPQIIQTELQRGVKFYDDLHVRVSLVAGTTPAPFDKSGLSLREDFSPHVFELFTPSTGPTGMGNVQPQPDFGDAKWNVPKDKNVLVALFVAEFLNIKVTIRGESFLKTQITALTINQGQKFTEPAGPCFFLQTEITAAGAAQRCPHEMGHCLLYEPGMGTTILKKVGAEAQVTAFLGKLDIEGPTPAQPAGSTTFQKLPADIHVATSGNLMDAKSTGTDLFDWQVAVIRACDIVGDGP